MNRLAELASRLPSMSPERRALCSDLARLIGGSERLADFIVRVSPHRPPPRHLRTLVAAIERARWERSRILLSMPPRHGKTITILHGLAWWIQQSPADTCAYVSYSDRQALSKSRICRTMAGIAGVNTSTGDSSAASEWRTREGGGLIAAGAMAGITGQGVHGLMVVDDPYKNREEADSSIIREKIWETFNEVVFTRLEGASVIVCHTRWHPDDMIARLIEMGGWQHINLAAIAEEDDQLKRPVGAALWPDMFDVAQLQSIRSQIGEWSFSALYQGHPRPRGHALFNSEHYHEDDKLNGHRLIIYADPAASEKTTADYGVMMCMAVKGFGDQQTAKVLDLWRGQVTVPDFVRRLRSFQEHHGGVPVHVESVGGFKAVPQLLRELDNTHKLAVEEDQPKGDKFQRAQAVAAAWNEGRVTVPFGAHWVRDFVDEVTSFTGISDAHDDQVDCLSGCWNKSLEPPSPGSYFRTKR